MGWRPASCCCAPSRQDSLSFLPQLLLLVPALPPAKHHRSYPASAVNNALQWPAAAISSLYHIRLCHFWQEQDESAQSCTCWRSITSQGTACLICKVRYCLADHNWSNYQQQPWCFAEAVFGRAQAAGAILQPFLCVRDGHMLAVGPCL